MNMMKAILCEEYGAINQLEFSESKIPEIQPDEILIKTKYCGVNFPDTLIVQGKYQFKPDLPFSPGGEVCGEVYQVGEKVRRFKVGDMVLAAMGWGGFAEYAAAKSSNAFLLPEGVDERAAAALLETYATAFYALKDRGMLQAGQRLLVLGAAGGTGTAAIQIAKLFGAKVVAVASTEEKRAFAEANGADLTLAPSENLKNELKEIGGIDVIFDPVGGELSEQAFRSIRPNGRHLVVGFATGEVPSIPLNLPLLKSASLVGVFWGHFWRNYPAENRKNIRLLLKWLAEGKIRPNITKVFPLEEASAALQELVDRKAQGKLILQVQS